MRKIFSILAVLVVIGWSSLAFGQTWHTANQATIAWDEVSTLANGTALPATDKVKYKVWIKNAVTGGEPVELGEVIVLEYTITLNVEGKYFVGVSAHRYSSEDILLNSSTVSWSDVPESCAGNEAFGVQYYLAPSSVGGLRFK